jgi:TM2 domain-containing membrane protein YozV
MNNKQLALYELSKKSTAIAYILGFLFGTLGVHMFYLGENGQGFARLFLFLVGVVIPPLMILSVIVYIADAFITYGMVKDYNAKLLTAMGE